MANFYKALELERLKAKLALFDTRGMNWVLKDLDEYIGPEHDLLLHVNALKSIYKRKIEEIEQGGDLEQTKLNFNV
jgi:hypothetical protein